jgi:hypothetical protein
VDAKATLKKKPIAALSLEQLKETKVYELQATLICETYPEQCVGL